MTFQIIAVSDSHKHFQVSIDEYTKRMQKSLELLTLKPSRKDDPISIKREETARLLTLLTKTPPPIVLLSLEGKQMSSESFADYLENNQQQATFIIGGPYGVDLPMIQPRLDAQISFGKQTMPHGLALVVLLEQLWRAHCISCGKTYHY